MAESTLNFVDSPTVTWSVVDDPANSRYDIQANAGASPAAVGAEVFGRCPVAHLTRGAATAIDIWQTVYTNSVTVVSGVGGYLQIDVAGTYVLVAAFRFQGAHAGDPVFASFEADTGSGFTGIGLGQQATGALSFSGPVFAEPSVTYVAELAVGDKVTAVGAYWGSSLTASYDSATLLTIYRMGP